MDFCASDIPDLERGNEGLHCVDKLDIFWLGTPARHGSAARAHIWFDAQQTAWRTYSGARRWAENRIAECGMAFSRETVVRAKMAGLWNIFAGPHFYCAACEER